MCSLERSVLGWFGLFVSKAVYLCMSADFAAGCCASPASPVPTWGRGDPNEGEGGRKGHCQGPRIRLQFNQN